MLHSAEANHRIANNLSSLAGLVRQKAKKVRSGPESRALLLDVAGRIDTIARLHDLLASAKSERFDVGAYLAEVCEAMKSALEGGEAIDFDFAFEKGVEAPPEMGLPLGMLTAELLTNSVKYAHPAGVPLKIRLACTRIGGCELDYEFEDDGVGFPEGFDPDREGGLGLQLVRSLAAQMRARGKWSSGALGLGYRMIAPLQEQRANGRAR